MNIKDIASVFSFNSRFNSLIPSRSIHAEPLVNATCIYDAVFQIT